ncbi:helix-turn-helix transcriptional regulator [Actinoplanes sp. LDG1-06]|uniref:Helix-turn-helix transcriptional regulator n=1 Tax=Paractinoplanes ovalisporus TaxID=2810368 RepID=A0ABS2A9G2_9ACTN|nr:helix-turn-helix transcriptional regulator [Actinoplanes ovalisporus]
MSNDVEAVLTSVGPRLRELRQRRDITLTALAATTGISISTLSRLESGQRRPSLEPLLPLAQAEFDTHSPTGSETPTTTRSSC